MAKAEVLQREKQVRSEVEKEMEIDRLRRKLAKKEAKERQPQLSSASHLVGAPTATGVGPSEEVLVAVLNREMDRNNSWRLNVYDVSRSRQPSHASRCHPLSCLSRPLTRVRHDLLLLRSREAESR